MTVEPGANRLGHSFVESIQGVVEVDPEAALELWHLLAGWITTAKNFAPLIIESVTDDGETFTGARCPHCESLLGENDLLIVDWATEATASDDVNAEEGYYSVNYDHEASFETLYYMTACCRRPVDTAGLREEN